MQKLLHNIEFGKCPCPKSIRIYTYILMKPARRIPTQVIV